MASSTSITDPSAKSPPQWQARLAALLGHGRGPDDPDVRECREALAYWRCRRVIDSEIDQIGPDGLERLVGALRGAVGQ